MPWNIWSISCGAGTDPSTPDAPTTCPAACGPHQSGRGAKYTRSRLPVELIYQEPAADRSAALRREAAIKRMTHRQKWALAETYRRAAAAGGEETEG